MLLVPSSARDYLDPAEYRRDWTTHGSMTIRRQSALRTLLPAYVDVARLAVGVVAWALGLTGAALLRSGLGASSALGLTGTMASGVGAVLLVLGVGAGVVVILAGSRLSRGVILWALLPRLVDGDGNRRAVGSPAPPASASGEPVGSLLPRLLAAVVGAVVAVWWTVGVVRDAVAAAAGYAGGEELGIAAASAIGAAISWTAAVAAARGWYRVRGALTGRAGPGPVATSLRELHGPTAPGHQAYSQYQPQPAPYQPQPPPYQYQPPSAQTQYHYQPQPTTYPQPDGATQERSWSAPSDQQAFAAPPAASQPHRSRVPQVRVAGRLLEPGTTLLGRAPVPRADEHADHTVAVDDRTLSKTHLTVRVTTVGVFVTDRSSTNGTTLVTPSGEQRLVPWQESHAPLGARVRAGATELTVSASEPESRGADEDDVEHTVMRADRDEM